jgi:glycosyltransferase involved in cell wall biosynthesis
MKVFYVASSSPWPLDFGGSMRTAAVLAALERCADVELLAIADDPGARGRAWLLEHGAALWATAPEGNASRAVRIARAVLTGRSIPAARLFSGDTVGRLRKAVAASRPDVVVLGDTYIAEAAPALAGLGCRLIIDTHNVESQLWRDMAAIATSLPERAAYALLAASNASLERRTLKLADRVWAASAEDAAWYRLHLGLLCVDVVPNALAESPVLPAPGDDEATVMLSGFFAYQPNEDAALALVAASRVLHARGIDHRLCLVGRSPSRRMHAAARGLDHVEITGEVASIEPWMRRASVFAAPLRAGSGTKFKLLQAMLAGRAVLTTPAGARGLDLEHGRHAWICQPQGLADALAALLADPLLRKSLAAEARRHVLANFTQDRIEDAIRNALSGFAPPR